MTLYLSINQSIWKKYLSENGVGEMAVIPEVMQRLERIKQIHEKKNQDYTAVGSPFENFERSAEVSSWFKHNIDKVFTTLIATKLARLATLLNKDSAPNNESIADSFDDLATYCLLWAAKYEQAHKVIGQATESKADELVNELTIKQKAGVYDAIAEFMKNFNL